MECRTGDVAASGATDLLLVCTNAREDHAACSGAGAEAVYDAVRTWLRERDLLWRQVRLARTSCLGLCSEDGAAVVLQPAGEWFAEVTVEDVPTLLASLFGGPERSPPASETPSADG